MTSSIETILKQAFTFRWKPNRDLAVVAISWLLVVGTLYTATVIVGPDSGGGLPYFILYAVVAATLFGVGIPLYWTVMVSRRPLADLGLTTRWLGLSVGLQFVFAILQYVGTLAKVQLPPFEQLVPLTALALAIGLFEAVFWRGWILLRLEGAFGVIPAVLLGSLLYAAYHIGYAMPMMVTCRGVTSPRSVWTAQTHQPFGYEVSSKSTIRPGVSFHTAGICGTWPRNLLPR